MNYEGIQMNLVISQEPDSLVQFINNMHTILYPGFGLIKGGRPISNQSYEGQQKFLKRYANQQYLPISYVNKYGDTTFLGNYKLKDLNKRISSSGFQYYEYRFVTMQY